MMLVRGEIWNTNSQFYIFLKKYFLSLNKRIESKKKSIYSQFGIMIQYNQTAIVGWQFKRINRNRITGD